MIKPAEVAATPDAVAATVEASEHPGGSANAATPSPSPPRPTPAELDRMGDEIAELAAHIDAAEYRLLERLAEFDRLEGWTGFLSCAHWMSWRTGIGPGAAREKMRVARALEQLPLISERMRLGEFSYSKVRALTRIATPSNEWKLVEFTRHASAAQTERMVQGWRLVDRVEAEEAAEAAEAAEAEGAEEAEEAEEAATAARQKRDAALDEELRHDSRHLNLWRKANGSWRIEGELDPEVGALVERALEMAEEALFRQGRRSGSSAPGGEEAEAPSPPPADLPGPRQRRADALGLVAEAALRSGVGDDASTSTGRADRFLVTLHRMVDASGQDSPKDASGQGSLKGGSVVPLAELDAAARASLGFQVAGGLDVPAETSKRLSCDASVVVVTHDAADGSVLDVGRRSRSAPPALARALDHRDGKMCRFPGCSRRFCARHHIEHWTDGGATKIDNLVLLCRTHHRAVHEGGYRVAFVEEAETEMEMTAAGVENPGAGVKTGTADGRVLRLRFWRPDGRLLPEVPEPVAVAGDPVRTLEQRSEEHGLEMDAWTAAPAWGGRLDLDFAIGTMWEPRE